MMPIVKALNGTAEQHTQREWAKEINTLQNALSKLTVMFYRLTQGNWQDRLAQWTKQDTKDVGDALDKLMTELGNYASVLYSKAPSRSNWPDSVGASIASAMDGFTEEIMDLRDHFPWELFGDETVAVDEVNEDRSAEEVLEDFADSSALMAKLFPNNPLLQKCSSLILTATLCTQAWCPPSPPAEEEQQEQEVDPWDTLKSMTSPRMIAFFATMGTSEAVAMAFGKGCYVGEWMDKTGRNPDDSDFWMHW
ncbi:uncharacterized protein N7506_005661 [Penicillium brevicompactum]|uniref:uncharacterized protein n=1 Tax=Penicillium brevicompactum TaxID=5074 RepID=UPI002540E898|nr:uncharacterized protein N7506_005661 [Penicillium brevicompactum]KAJ5335725.1 hypothetical protein N7506_005661 [Penicillium brevicompactum]